MTYKISKLFALFITILLIVSCRKNEQFTIIAENPIAKKSINEQRQYVRDNFKKIMKELKPIFKDSELKAILYSEIAKKFDGDYNVLIKTLINNPQVSCKVNKEKVNSLLAAFYNIDGRNYHPQIYIPNFQKHISTQSLRTSTDEVVEAVFYDGDETVNEKPTYTFNEDGEVVPTGNIADEDYSLAKPLYIFGLNENSYEDPIIYTPSVTNNTSSTVNAKIEYMTIRHLNESWLAGASEVCIRALSTTWNHKLMGVSTNPQVSINNIRTTTSLQGHEIWKLQRVLCGYEQLVNYPLNINWEVTNFTSDPIVYTYVIFEADAWPIGTKVAASLIPSNPDPLTNKDYFEFRSNDESYGCNLNTPSVNNAIYGNISGLSNNFHDLYYDGRIIDRADIKYNIRKY
ncbi:MAG: hypothetical protein V9E96_14800 [Chitinophagaceae bacterium]